MRPWGYRVARPNDVTYLPIFITFEVIPYFIHAAINVVTVGGALPFSFYCIYVNFSNIFLCQQYLSWCLNFHSLNSVLTLNFQQP